MCSRYFITLIPAFMPDLSLDVSHAALPLENAPDELCCPTTLALFVDPVQTICGQMYERAAFEDRLTSHKTNPMTGETLLTTAVCPTW